MPERRTVRTRARHAAPVVLRPTQGSRAHGRWVAGGPRPAVRTASCPPGWPRPAGPRSAPTHHNRPPMATLAHTTPIDRRALSAERAPTPARPCPGTKRHGCDGRRTRARHGRGGVPSGDSDTGPAQARRPWRTGAARRVGFQSRPERVTCGHRLRVLGTRTLTEYGGQHPRRGGKGQRCPSSQPTLRRRTMRPTRKPTTITMAT
jgi:hypothetical protein